MTYVYAEFHNGHILAVTQGDVFFEEDLDELCPMVFRSGGRSKNVPNDVIDTLPDTLYMRNRRVIGDTLGWTEGDWIEIYDDHRSLGNPLGEIIRDKVQEDFYGTDDIDLMETIATALGVVCLSFTGHGYCQGDYIEGLAYADDAFLKRFYGKDIPKDPDVIKSALESHTKLYTAWAFGDVYEANIYKAPDGFDGLDEDGHLMEGDDLISALDDFDPDWNCEMVDGMTLAEQLPDFDTHPDIQEMLRHA